MQFHKRWLFSVTSNLLLFQSNTSTNQHWILQSLQLCKVTNVCCICQSTTHTSETSTDKMFTSLLSFPMAQVLRMIRWIVLPFSRIYYTGLYLSLFFYFVIKYSLHNAMLEWALFHFNFSISLPVTNYLICINFSMLSIDFE